MAIYNPGKRHRNHKLLSRRGGKRAVTAILSLTAMVDMFTVLVIFLLQNYNTTGEILYIPKDVVLPKANRVLELKPSVVVTVTAKEVLLDRTPVATFEEVKQATDWVIPNLRDQTRDMLLKAKADQEQKLQSKLSKVVDKTLGKEEEDPEAWRKVTIQADKQIDYLTLKKIMYSIYEAGGGPINFAVAKDLEANDMAVETETK
ncbi:MAG: adventurous gliding motility protein [Pseudobdellovibrio sp.]|jgi:biopolymer transport protein ExbD|nr:adventurous gliding motility protein [Pseudobdellovibrio sp.]